MHAFIDATALLLVMIAILPLKRICLRVFAYASRIESIAINYRLAKLGWSMNDGIDLTTQRVKDICPGKPAIQQGAG